MEAMNRSTLIWILAAVTPLWLSGCELVGKSNAAQSPRLSMFVGVDVSGSFMNGPYFDDSIDFLASYIYCHLNGVGGMERPNALFVSSIGGARADEPKTFYPIQTFENKSVGEIAATLRAMFPKDEPNPFTDYNAFFEQVAYTVRSKNLVLRPVAVVMVSDGIPDVKREGATGYDSIVVRPLERLARSVTIRLLYTSAIVGKNWQTKVKRKRVKVWTQDAEVMVSWNDEKIMVPDATLETQPYFFDWVGDNVDFGVRARRID
jgi:hypothetical protein